MVTRRRPGPARVPVFLLLCLITALWGTGPASAEDGGRLDGRPASVERGAYLARAAGCVSCHSAPGGDALSGGRRFVSDFGTFVAPNITPDPQAGIGGWTEAQFVNAVRRGIRPDGAYYYPAFPYASFTGMSDEDVRAIKVWLDTLDPVSDVAPAHEVSGPAAWRPLIGLWRILFFRPGRFEPNPRADAVWNRGAYLTRAVTHCGECHTPRNALGGRMRGLELAGTSRSATGERVPNITPARQTGVGGWSVGEMAELMKSGMKPDFDNVQGSMADAIRHGLRHMTDADRTAIAYYVLTSEPIEHRVGRR